MRKQYCRRVIAILLLALTFVITPALASTSYYDSKQVQIEETRATRAEVKEWKFSMINGVRHKRLWSVTYERWLTDWIRC